ncbi:DUF3417 domain-containing protein, partial [Propionibacterium freudenreichii]|uniref:DUF3417 domain-containing protein n=2 Tax=Propionibacterium freudenreichii TaxID=1744 RepID=UPI002E7B16DD
MAIIAGPQRAVGPVHLRANRRAACVPISLVDVRAIRRFIVQPVLPESLKPLAVLARNLRWSWHQDTQDLFEAIDPVLWEETSHDPQKLLSRASRERLDTLAGDRR